MPSAEVRVRRAVIDDWSALVELEASVFGLDRMSARQWRAHLESDSACVLVATRERHLIGAAVLFFRRKSRVARLYSIATAAPARGRGVGVRLLEKAERVARERGRQSLRLEVRRDNANARGLYEHHGYRCFGERAAYYEDGQDAVRYEKALAAADG